AFHPEESGGSAMVTAASVESLETVTASTYTFTSESVTEGHPDKVCDFVADSILDACLEQDPHSRVACEVLAKEGRLVLAGEITSSATIDREALARAAVREIGYVHADESFNAAGLSV